MIIQETSCGIIPLYHNADGNYKVLVVQHKGGRHRSFPKGHVESGEDFFQTAQRECYEETGLKFKDIDPKRFDQKYQFVRNDDTIRKRVYYFVGLATDDHVDILEKEIKAYRRLPLDQVRHQLTFYNDKRLRDQVLKYLLGT